MCICPLDLVVTDTNVMAKLDLKTCTLKVEDLEALQQQS